MWYRLGLVFLFSIIALLFISCKEEVDEGSTVIPINTFRPLYGTDYSQKEINYTFSNYKLLIIPEPNTTSINWDFISYNSLFFIYKDVLFSKEWESDFNELDESFFIKDSQNNKIKHTTFNSYLMDVSNQAYISLCINSIKRFIDIYPFARGIFLDDYWSEIYTSELSGEAPNWLKENITSYLKEFIRQLRNSIPTNIKIITNDQLYEEYTLLSDGGMDEGFVHSSWMDDENYYLSSEEVEELLHKIKYLSEIGKTILLISSTHKTNQSDIDTIHLYTLSAYLLIVSGNIYYYWRGTTDNYDNYSEIPNFYYNIKLGKPTGNFYKKNSLLIRNFENGIVILNPTSDNITYTLNESYTKIEVNAESNISGNITIPPRNGFILIKN